MKRFLVLMIVFAMTSAASAATIEILVNGNPYTGGDTVPSDIISIQLIDDRGPTFLVGALAESTIDVSFADNYSHTFFALPSIGGWNFTPAGGGYTSIGAGTWFGMTLPADGIIFTHEFHFPDSYQASDEVIIDYNIAYQFLTEQVGRIVLHVVPEPSTIALLGIGALSLLRRRRK